MKPSSNTIISVSLCLYINIVENVRLFSIMKFWFTRTENTEMKRQRSAHGSGTTRLQTAKATTRKKAKTRVGQGKEEVAAAEVLVGNQVKNDREFSEFVKAEDIVDWDEWPCLWVAVDEQMSWGTCWSPSWDMEFLDGEAYRALYNDVVWEDDIWDLKDIKNVPSSLPSP